MSHFYGIEVGRNYKFLYTCESCGKTVEKKHNIATKIGQEYNKVMWVYANSEQEAAMVEQGKANLAPLCDALNAEWEKGNYPQAVREASVCPFCKKRQHWDWQFSDENRAFRKTAGRDLGNAALGIIGGLILTLILALTGLTKVITFWGTWLVSAVVLFVFFKIWLGGDDKKLDAEYVELDGKEKKYPSFIAWENFWHKNIGLIRT